MIRNIRKAIVAIAIAGMMIVPLVGKSGATASPAPALAFAGVDINSEARTLNSFVDDLGGFDKKGSELAKRPSLTRAEFAAYERQGEDLKRRVSGLQNALRQIITKLKAAGQFDNINQTVLSKIRDSNFQSVARNNSFKSVLEEFASQLSDHANEISDPIESLRSKVSAQAQVLIFEKSSSALASRAVRVAYNPASPMYATNFKCRLAWLRVGITGAFSSDGNGSDRSVNALGCYCLGIQTSCDAL